MKTPTVNTPLREIHEACGAKPGRVLDALRELSPDPDAAPKNQEAVNNVIRRGTKDTLWIEAMAQAYGRSVEEIRRAALLTLAGRKKTPVSGITVGNN